MTSKQVTPAEKRKPPAAGMGRKKGSVNKTTALLKDAIIKAAELVGEDGEGKGKLTGYLTFLAKGEPKAFSVLLGKVLPIQVAGDPDNPLQHVHKVERHIVRPPNPNG